MKSLETIQKAYKVFHILAIIAMALSFLWAGLSFIGAIWCLIYDAVPLFGFIKEILAEYDFSTFKTCGVLLSDFVFGLTDGFLFFFAQRYFKEELDIGTPFTFEGADTVKALGIKTIVMPLVSIIICAVIYACFDISLTEKFGNGGTLMIGIMLILASFILRHGSEINENMKTRG